MKPTKEDLTMPTRFLLIALAAVLCTAPLAGRQAAGDLNQKIDALILPAFELATAGFPCKVGTRGKPKMLQWQDVDDCLNNRVSAKVDWESLSKSLRNLRDGIRDLSALEFAAAVDSAMARQTVPYEKMFVVKDEKALLPLTNSVLKFMPADSLQDTPVFDRVGTLMGTFSGVFSYESSGSGNPYRLSMFQYTDRNGEFKSAPDKLLLDSFGIPWREVRSHPGFRLSSDKLQLAVR
jgi:hypothetical protein